VPKVRKPSSTSRANKPRAGKPTTAKAATKAPAAPAPVPDVAETIACMHCGHVNAVPGGIKPGRTVSCKLCARMFSVEAAAAHVAPPPPEPPPPPPGMTPHAPTTDSVDAPAYSANLIYTPQLGPKKKLSRTFKFTLGLMISVVLVAVGVGLAVMVPTWNRIRVAAKRNTCVANLKKIGSAVDLYAYSNYGMFPEGFARLMTIQQLPADALICPDGNETPAGGATPAAQAEDLARGRHSSYTYTGKGLNKRSGAGAGAAAVVAYEPLTHHGEGIHVLFSDGHVAFVPLPQAKQVIADLQAGKNPPGVTGF